jgi:hypothetical protein
MVEMGDILQRTPQLLTEWRYHSRCKTRRKQRAGPWERVKVVVIRLEHDNLLFPMRFKSPDVFRDDFHPLWQYFIITGIEKIKPAGRLRHDNRKKQWGRTQISALPVGSLEMLLRSGQCGTRIGYSVRTTERSRHRCI